MFKLQFFHNKLPGGFEGSFILNSAAHGRLMRHSNDVYPPPIKKSICRQSILMHILEWNP